MEYTNLGNTHLKVSRLCLGTMNFGVKTEEKQAFRIMDMALDAGINFFDTANNYGMTIHKEGITEQILGRWFAQDRSKRQRVVLTTKVHECMRNPLDGPNDEQGLSRFKIRRHFEESLKRLGTDHVEIYFMHHYDRQMNMEEVADTFAWLIAQGRVDYMGTSNFPAWALADLCTMTEYRHIPGPVCEQHKYNLMCRTAELEVIPSVRKHKVGLVTYSPLGNGMMKKCGEPSEGSGQEPLAKFAALCRELGEKPADVAIAWILHNPTVTAPIMGPSTPEQFTGTLKALEIRLPQDFLEKLDEIFPGPGEAPESYAW